MSRATPGEGRIFHQQYTRDGVTKATKTWYIQFYDPRHGKPVTEKTGSMKWKDARKLLNRRLGEVEHGTYVGAKMNQTTLGECLALVETDYTINGRRSLARMQQSRAHVLAFFGGKTKVIAIAPDRIDDYVQTRLKEGAQNATVNRELSCLKRALRLGQQKQKVAIVPPITLLKESNTRTGFFERPLFEAVRSFLPEELRGLVTFMYLTGWRLGNVLRLPWSQVDVHAGVVRLEPGTTKNDDGVEFPFSMLPELETVLRTQWEMTKAVERETGQIVPWVFHRNGQPIRYFRRSWARACYLAGVGQLNPETKAPRALKFRHDFRRTAVRNLERAGVSRSVAMGLVGMKTQSIYSRYAIKSKQDLKDGVAKLAVLHQADAALPRQVVPLRVSAGEGLTSPPHEIRVNGHHGRVGRVSKNSSKPGIGRVASLSPAER
jgi:integrase